MLKEKKLAFVADSVRGIMQQALNSRDAGFPSLDDYRVYEEITGFIRAARTFSLPVTVTVSADGEVVLNVEEGGEQSV